MSDAIEVPPPAAESQKHEIVGDLTGYEDFAQHDDVPAWRKKLTDVVNSLPVALFVLFLILLDLIMAIVVLAQNDDEPNVAIEVVVAFVLSLLCLELLGRIVAMGLLFFYSVFNDIDLFVMFLSLLFNILVFRAGAMVVVLRVMRVARVILYIRRQRERMPATARKYVSQNRRRLQDVEGGFDLDITFITSRVAAMSWPSTGKEALYRNPIGDVARFYNTKYENKYWLYNLCAERDYDYTKFHDRVSTFPMRDHNPARMSLILDFCKAAQTYLEEDPGHIIGVNCKGGKGRTGTMIASFLLYSGAFEDANEALDFFANQRTSEGGEREGVEEPSQQRYVEHFGELINQAKGFTANIEIPQGDAFALTKLRVFGVKAYRSNAKEESENTNLVPAISEGLWVVVEVDEKEVYNQRSESGVAVSDCYVYDEEQDMWEFDLPDVVVVGDVKVGFMKPTEKGGKHAFGFWEHTAWMSADKSPWRLDRTMTDGAHKEKAWKRFTSDFAIEVTYRKT